MKYDGFIFDIDGVLLDTSRSFNSAVVEAVTFATNSNQFTFIEIVQLKSIKGFNNDWHAAIAGAGWIQYRPEVPFEAFLQEIKQYGNGLSGLRRSVPELKKEFEQYLTKLTQEAYGGTTQCRKLYGFEPEFIRVPGWWQTEKSNVTEQQMTPILSKSGIVTGRSKSETDLAMNLLGWRLPDSVIAYSDDPSLDKPNPDKLRQIIKNIGCKNPLYVGDGRDDLELAKNYLHATGNLLDFCLIKSENNISEFNLIFESVGELFEKLEINHGKNHS